MKGKTHRAIGTAIGIFISSGYSLNSRIVIISSSIIGSLIPDIDHSRNSFNQKYLRVKNDFAKSIVYTIISLVFGYLGYRFKQNIFITLSMILALTGFSNHRGFTHSLLGIYLYYKLMKEFSIIYDSKEVLIGFMSGYISHVLLDLSTKDGVKLLYPMKGHISLPHRIKTKGMFEKVISNLAGIYSIYSILKYTGIINTEFIKLFTYFRIN